jgi:hypothetical protein
MLNDFRDAVFMSPAMNLAQPTVTGTALETQFVAGMASDMTATETAELFQLDLHLVHRAMQFEEAVA